MPRKMKTTEVPAKESSGARKDEKRRPPASQSSKLDNAKKGKSSQADPSKDQNLLKSMKFFLEMCEFSASIFFCAFWQFFSCVLNDAPCVLQVRKIVLQRSEKDLRQRKASRAVQSASKIQSETKNSGIRKTPS